jgi:hypothetical protein
MNQNVAAPRYRIEERVQTESGWHVHRVHDFADQRLAAAVLQGMRREYREAVAVGDWDFQLVCAS